MQQLQSMFDYVIFGHSTSVLFTACLLIVILFLWVSFSDKMAWAKYLHMSFVKRVQIMTHIREKIAHQKQFSCNWGKIPTKIWQDPLASSVSPARIPWTTWLGAPRSWLAYKNPTGNLKTKTIIYHVIYMTKPWGITLTYSLSKHMNGSKWSSR